jgi:uncharacterized protein with PCYCGC motif
VIIAGVAGVALVTLLVTTRTGHAAAHPEPRLGITADRVLPPGMVRNTPDAREAYAAARSAPQVLDGLYCHCHCARHFGHRSLLTCFESDHGAQCDICIGEALLAARLAASGSSLEQIRHAIDARFQS